MDANNKELLDLFCQHLVGISWYQGMANEQGKYVEQPQCGQASGFIMDVYGMWWLVTAGHVIRDNEKDMKIAGMQTTKPTLFDHWSPLATVHKPIYFDFFDTNFHGPVIYNTDLGLDFALIRLPNYIQKEFSNTIKPFRRQDWITQASMEFDFYGVVGLPVEERIEKQSASSIDIYPVPVIIFLDKVNELPKGIKETEYPRFFGRLHEKSTIASVGGMSGGPIIGFKREAGGIRYFPVALQSAQLQVKNRIVIGCPTYVIGACCEQFFSSIEEQLSTEDETSG